MYFGTMRLFVAIPVPAEPAQAIVALALATIKHDRRTALASSAHPRLMHPADLHLTLFFLGTTLGERLPEIEAALREIASPQLSIQTGAMGAFARAGAVYLDVDRSEGLRGLAEAVVQRMESCGFRRDARPYHPHITIARAPRSAALAIERQLSKPGSSQKSPSALRFYADRFNLYRTSPQSGGPRYETLESFPLRQVPLDRASQELSEDASGQMR
jgi:RNA 2',3'-cyclic 3'-phosphodiesterase